MSNNDLDHDLDLSNPSAADAPLVAMLRKSPDDQTDDELRQEVSRLRAMRTTSVTMRATTSNKVSRSPQPKLSFNPNDLF